MLSTILPPALLGALCALLTILWIILAFVFLLPGILLRLLPVRALQRLGARYCVQVAVRWVQANRLIYALMHRTPWQPVYHQALDPAANYLVICNHQSWADIPLLFDVLHRRAPFPRFFMKWELLYVPVIGVGCWAMDFPFMRRYSQAKLAAHPELRGKDLEATRRACERYQSVPVSVINFIEGTRLTPAKHARQQSPYQYLLRPKAGGLSFTLNAMGEQFAGIIDVTIGYQPTRKRLLWSLLCGEQNQVQIDVEVRPIPTQLIHGDYAHDPDHRQNMQDWVNQLWQQKDARLARIKQTQPSAAL